MWGKLSAPSVGEEREEDLKDLFWRDLLEMRARMTRFEASFESAWQVVGMAEKQDNPNLRTQYEQVRQQLKATFKQLQTLKIPSGRRISQFFEFKNGKSVTASNDYA
ncbi:hypothetical protein ONZ45_g7117 [Pleurotus djamor]|nr:hypothetical protein ONZ45_g7117 [Pleurotus djamor]